MGFWLSSCTQPPLDSFLCRVYDNRESLKPYLNYMKYGVLSFRGSVRDFRFLLLTGRLWNTKVVEYFIK